LNIHTALISCIVTYFSATLALPIYDSVGWGTVPKLALVWAWLWFTRGQHQSVILCLMQLLFTCYSSAGGDWCVCLCGGRTWL